MIKLPIDIVRNTINSVKQYFKDLKDQPTFEDSLNRLEDLAKYKQDLENKVEVQNKVIELQRQENDIQSSLLEEYRAYAPKNQQCREGKKYKGDVINLVPKNGDYFPYE